MQKNKQNIFQQLCGDRFIPIEVHKEAFLMESTRIIQDKPMNNYVGMLKESMRKESGIVKNKGKKIMNFTTKKSRNPSLLTNILQINNKTINPHTLQRRKISKKAYKVLQAPGIQDNFYLNLLDWSPDNRIAVALQNQLYLWNHHSTEAVKIYETTHGDQICSVNFCNSNTTSIGNNIGEISFIDLETMTKVRQFDAHQGRVGSLNWDRNLLASGSKDGYVGIWDLRGGLVNKYKAHSQQICGLKWSPDSKYIASGGNDNKLVVYSHSNKKQIARFNQHTAAVKAIGWNERDPSTLASGGGTADKHIRFYSLKTLQETFHIDTGSQICNLMFSKISNQMITTHGYSLNQINVWDSSNNWATLEGMRHLQTLTGHHCRVLYLAGSPDGTSIVTGAGDQTLRFWKVFQNNQLKKPSQLGQIMDLR